jgi:hypothetical protein
MRSLNEVSSDPSLVLKALWHLNNLNAIRKLLPLYLPFILQHKYGPTTVAPGLLRGHYRTDGRTDDRTMAAGASVT